MYRQTQDTQTAYTSSSAINSHAVPIFSLADATKPAVWSSAEPHSLVARSAPCGHVSWCLSAYFGQDWRMWSGVWSACPHSHREVSEMPILFRWALRPQCPVCRRKIVVCWTRSSLQTGSRAYTIHVMVGRWTGCLRRQQEQRKYKIKYRAVKQRYDRNIHMCM